MVKFTINPIALVYSGDNFYVTIDVCPPPQKNQFPGGGGNNDFFTFPV